MPAFVFLVETDWTPTSCTCPKKMVGTRQLGRTMLAPSTSSTTRLHVAGRSAVRHPSESGLPERATGQLMITAIKNENGDVDLVMEGRQPTVYIDLDSLSDIAKNEQQRQRLLSSDGAR
jgi:hypothetical protein